MRGLSPRNKVPLVPRSHFNGLARTQPPNFPLDQQESPNAPDEVVTDTRTALNYLLEQRGGFALLPTPLAVDLSTAQGGGWLSPVPLQSPQTYFLTSLVGLVQTLGVLVGDHPPGKPDHRPGSGSPSDPGKVLSQNDKEAP